MKSVAITGKRQCEFMDLPDPKAKEDFVIVKIHSAPMCTEYHAYEFWSDTYLGKLADRLFAARKA